MDGVGILNEIDGIAVIGMSCRFPGARNVDEFWRNLRDGVESITFFSDQELRDSGIDPALINDPNYVKAGCVIEDIDLFDASFFGYSPKEAETIDPQQRLFLECAWEAIEVAGYVPQTYEGLIGVFGGARMSSYVNNVSLGLSRVGTASWFQALIGNDKDYITTRVSYKLNLRGPSIAVQSACSTSLVAVHLACESLWNAECDMALAGGAAITVPQKQGYLYQEGMILAPDGHCRAFDARAQGMIGGNGVGIVLLKKLSDALADGDHINAVIKGSAVNNDGSSKVGYTAPSLEGQTAVISEALAMADVEPETITYVETHGAGTYLGDPIEVEALTRVFRANTDNRGFCALGSVKTNFGHLDTAAGIASLIKTVLALKYKHLPPSLHFEKPNPMIDFSNTPFFVNAKLSEWKVDGYPRRAGVSSFGIGGTNAHVVLEEAPPPRPADNDIERPLHLMTLSARSKNALQELAHRYETFLETHPDASLADACFTANVGRAHFPYRLAVAAESTKQLHEQMAAFAAGPRPTGLVSRHVQKGSHPKVAFLFTGQGSQYVGMGQQLYYTQPTFRKALDRCAEILKSHLDRPLLPVIFEKEGDSSVLDETTYTQPALFALEYALAEMWQSWGIEPSIVMGHSIGEYVAACVAGVFSLEDGLKLIAARGRLIQALPQEGEMAAVFAGEERVAAAVAPYANDVSIAAINGPENVVISGVRKSVRKILDNLASEGIKAVKLKVSHPFHSPLIESMLTPFEEIASQIKYSAPRIDLISNVTGRLAENNEVCEASYWRRHVQEPVRFASGLQALHEQRRELFLEIGPSPVLSGMGRRCLPEGTAVWLPSLRGGRSDWTQVLESLAELYVHGVEVDWSRFDHDYLRCRMSLPTYPFERKRYWISRRSVDSDQWSIATDKGQQTTDNKQIWNSLVEAGRMQAQQGITELKLDGYSGSNQNLRRLYAAYATLALQSFRAFQHAKDRYSVETLLNRFPIQPRYRQLLSRLLEGLVEEGQLQRDGDMYENLIPVQTDSIDGLIQEAVTLFSENPKVLEFIQHCGENLGDVLVGKKDPMEVVFPDSSFDMVENLYQDNSLSRYYNLILREIVQKIVRSLPLDNRLSILEIGAGTGSTTASLLPVLPPDRTTYIYTDVSPIFLHRAQKKFSTYPFIEYKLLDIQQLPEDQDFKIHDYDMVIVANVLHATRDLNETMQHVRSLLAPHGVLLVREITITKPVLLFDITFGPLLIELVDEKLRKGRPFLSTGKWNDLLKFHDFVEVEVFPETDSESKVPDEHILVAQASSSATLPVPHAFTVSAKTKSEGRAPETIALAQGRSLATGVHPLLGQRLRSALPMFESCLNSGSLPSLKAHRIYGEIVLPGGAFFEMAFAAGEQLFETNALVLENLTMHEALIIPEGNAPQAVQTILDPEYSGEASFKIFSLVEAEDEQPETWKLHVTGNIRIERTDEHTSAKDGRSLKEVQVRCREEVSISDLYDGLRERGLFLSEKRVGWIETLWRQDKEALGSIRFTETLMLEVRDYRIHPSILDPCLQVLWAVFLGESHHSSTASIYLPVGVDRVRYYSRNADRLWCHAVVRPDEVSCEDSFTADFRLFDSAGEVVAEIMGVHMRHVSREAMLRGVHSELSDYFYEVQWQPKAPPKSTKVLEPLRPDQPGSWVIFADHGGVGEALAGLLKERGETCVMVFSGNKSEVSKKGPYRRIDPGNPEGFMKLFQQKLGGDAPPYRGVIHLWSLDAARPEELTTDSLKTAQTLGCGSVLHLIQALAKAARMEAPRLCLVTRGAQPVESEAAFVAVAQAPLWGLRKVIAKEHPEVNCLMVDLDPLGEKEDIYALWEELRSMDHEDEVAFRSRVRYVPRLVRSSSNLRHMETSVDFCPDGTYLITGGLGGMGLEVARWMVERGAQHLVLIGRRDPSDTAMEAINDLKKAGAQVVVARADVSDQGRLAEVFEEIRVSMPPLGGVFHLAGILEEGVLLQQKFEEFARVAAPKVEGAWNLHNLTRNLSLDFFVLFSSISSLLANHGLGSYIAGNTFLDSLAHHRRAQELPALSVNWGAFSEVGMIANDEDGARLREEAGISSFTPQQALSHLGVALRQDAAQVCVAKMDWSRFLRQFSGDVPPFLSEMYSKATPRGKDKASSAESAPILHQLRQAFPGQRQELLEHYLKQKIAQALHLDVKQLTKDGDLIQMGMDSLIFLSLAQVLAKELQIKIVPHEIFEMPAIPAMAKRIVDKIVAAKNTAEADAETAFGITILPDPEHRYLPFDLTDIQQAYWVGRSGAFELGNVACHAYFEIDAEELDLDRYTLAWQRLIERHDMLRAVFLPDGRQQILEHVPPYQIEVLDLRGEAPDAVEFQLKAIRQRMSHQVLRTDQWPLFEIQASRINDRRTRIHISLDLLIADVYSLVMLMKQLLQLYENPDVSLVPLELSFRDYVLAEAAFRDSNLYQRAREYWMKRLPTLPRAPDLPLAKNPGDIIQPRFVRWISKLEPKTWLRLKNRASEAGLTPSGILIAVYAEVLSVWSKSPRFCINLTIFNRLDFHPQINDIVGDFTSVILLEVDNSTQGNFEVRAQHLQRQFWNHMDHRYFSGVQVLRELARSEGRPSGAATMPVVFTGNIHGGEDQSFVTVGDLVYNIGQTPQVWVEYQASEEAGALRIWWDALEDLFPHGLLDDMFNAYCRLLQRLADEEDAWQETARQLIPPAQVEKRAAVNATEAPVSFEMLHTLFAAQVSKQPDHPAVVCSNRTLTYQELCNYANKTGRLLREKGAQPNTLVAVVMQKGWEQVVAVFGILQSGAAYLPIDPELPRERLWHLLDDGEVSLVLTQSWLDEELNWPGDIQRFSVDKMGLTDKALPLLDPMQRPDDLAYVIYTSGSTGLPKGVMIDHRGAVNTILDVNRRFGIGDKDKVLALSNLNFDLSVYDIFGTLAAGGTIVLPDAGKTKEPAHWSELMTREQVTIWNSVPALMQMLVEYASGRTEVVPRSLCLALLSGDCIPLDLPDKIRALVEGVRVISLGGATEASIWSNLYHIEEIDPNWKSIPYGRPMGNQRFYVLNELMQDCPDWVPGQLYIGGIGLAKGYWRDEEKTTTSFIIHPRTGERLYRTGDLGRYLPDGNIEFLGREDFQVKIRGYRIELGEIETTLKQHPEVRDAVVTAVGDPRGNKHLVGYVVPDGEEEPSTAALQSFLREKLPDYMVPSSLTVLDKLPLTPNGKIDRQALLAPEDVGRERKKIFVAPRTPTEVSLAKIWAQVLNINHVGIHDDFFELGGNSLLAVQLVSRVRQTLRVELPIGRLFETLNIAELAEFIEKELRGENSLAPLPEIVLDPEQRHLPFPLTDIQQAYWIGRSGDFELGNIATHYYIEIESDHLNIERLNLAWQRVIDRHEMLRAVVLPNGQQKILDQVPPYQVDVMDLRGRDQEVVVAELDAIRREMSHQVLPSDQWPLFDIRASQFGDSRVRLHISFDALLVDAWSFFSVTSEWYQIYEGTDDSLIPLNLSFRDYVLAVTALENSELYLRDQKYWFNRLPSLPPSPELPLARNPGSLKQPRFNRRSFTLVTEVWQNLKTQATQNGLTPSGLLIAAYADVLSVWSKSPRFTINLTLFNRLPLHPQVNNIVGDFTSLSLLAVENSGEEKFTTRASQLQQQLWQDIDHRHFSGIRVLREIARLREEFTRSAMPVVFTSALNMESLGRDVSGFDVLGEWVYGISQTPQVWLDHQVYEQDGNLIVIWDAVEELFPEGLLDDMFEAYCRFLQRLADEEESWQETTRQLIPASQLEKMTEVNATDAPISSEMLHTLFSAQVPDRPEQPAVISSFHTLTYEELFNRSNYVGRLLREKGAQPNALVAVVMEKGWEQVVAVLGILQSGAAYLPIDPELPRERLWHLLEDGQVNLILTQSWLDEKLDWPESVQRFSVDTMELTDKDVRPLDLVQGPEDLAYVIYTSGSTGLPKGVMIDHRGAVNTILDVNERFGVGPEDRVLALSNLNFDLSVYDIFGTLAAGGTIVLPDAGKTKEPAHWLELMTQEQLTIWNSVPALMQMFVEYASGRREVVPQSLRLVLLSGDWIPLDLPYQIKALVDGARLISLGGATEASIWSNLYPIEEVDPSWKSIPYGRPMVNQRYYVLNEFMEDCPDWVPGQLYIGGIGLAKGYWKEEVKTKESFINHPRTGERLYRTGDLGCYLPDGNMEFLGREDFQVKISGYRIELGEIETTLKHHPGVKDAVVIVLGESREEKHLVGYVVPNYEKESNLFEFKQVDSAMCASRWESVQSAGQLQASQIPDSVDIEAVPVFMNSVDRLSFVLMCQILHDMGIFSREEERYSIDELMQQFKIQPRYQTLVLHWLNVLEEEGLLGKNEAGIYLNHHSLNEEMPALSWEDEFEFSPKLSKQAMELYSFLRHNSSLYIDLLKGEIDPLELFLTEDNFLAAEGLDRFIPTREYYIDLSSEVFSTIMNSFPSDKEVQVLEIGTRAENLTGTLVSLLPKDRGRYLYADESSFFTDRARQKLGEMAPLEYGLFDMNKTPLQQGYEPHFFDVIVADNTLHRAKNIEITLEYLKEMLAPGGLLFLIESTQNSRLMLTTVGFFEDGFSHLEDERKTTHLPLITAEKWREVLHKKRFSKVMTFPESGHAADVFGQHLMVAQAPEAVRIFEPANLADAMRRKLPDYMVPTTYVLLDELPLSANGKVDRKALAKLGKKTEKISKETYVAPFTKIQVKIASVWTEILGCTKVGIHDNFFELGGDSLRAIQCINLLKELYQMNLSLQDFFEAYSVDRLAKKIEEELAMEENLELMQEGEI